MTAKKVQLEERWRTADRASLAAEVLERLRAGKGFDGLALDRHDGRLDLRGLTLSAPTPSGPTQQVGRLAVTELKGTTQLRGVHWTELDLSYAALPGLSFFESTIQKCRFEGARLDGLGAWALDVEASSFVGASLRNAVLGSWYKGRENTYHGVSFAGADLRGLMCSTATFIDCDFSNARLVKVDFDASGFMRCRFAGLLEEIQFYDRDLRGQKRDRNPMEDVDFSQAELRWVEFRNLDLQKVMLPEDDRHVRLTHYRCVLEKAISACEAAGQRGLRGYFESELKWCPPGREIGIFNKRDLQEVGDLDFALDVLARAEHSCASEQ